MLNKVFAGLVIAFWAAMMTALLRVEVFPQPTTIETFSTERIMRKVFSNPEPLSLDVYYNSSNHIGHCMIEIQPQTSDKPGDGSGSTQKVVGYKVISDLKVPAVGIRHALAADVEWREHFQPEAGTGAISV